MGENKEAIRNYKQCIQTLSNIESYHAALICIYPFYCGALADEKLYGDLKDATERGNKYAIYIRRNWASLKNV